MDFKPSPQVETLRERILDFMATVMPRWRLRVELYELPEPCQNKTVVLPFNEITNFL